MQEHVEKKSSRKDHNVHDTDEDLIDILLRIKESKTLKILITNNYIQEITLVSLVNDVKSMHVNHNML